ncbi:Hypothetical protein A7982_08312 [Minicystis rosea]|nr:Hypothetical protein A7982_08312 [Minicystis rosea]
MSLLPPPLSPEREGHVAFAPEDAPLPVSCSWKDRFDDPLNRFYRYPVARLIVRVLMHTPVTPNQVTFVQPFLAAAAGYCVTFADHRHLILAALLFEFRSVLDCVDGTLARAKKMTSANGHVIDAVADWLGTVLLYSGIFWHFHLHPPPPGPLTSVLPVSAVILIALWQGALRSFAADYYRTKIVSIFEQGRDDTIEAMRRKVRAIGPDSSLFARIDVIIGHCGHISFEHRMFNPDEDDRSVARIQSRESTPLARWVAGLWSITNGDAFLSMIVFAMLANRLWEAQVFFATAGVVWAFAVIALSGRLVRP